MSESAPIIWRVLRKPRWLLFAAFVVVLALVGLAGLSVATVRRPFPQVDGEISLPGLTTPVEVIRDQWGVANIYADNAEDLFEAQGYVQAQDRFFEMDVRRHITAGRLSELFGASQVETDTFIRTLGWRRVATAELPLLSASTRRYLDAYADGVNAYLQSHRPASISLEYSLLGLQGLDYAPEPWTAVDSLSWLKAMAWDLGANLDREVETSLMLPAVGPKQTADLWPDYPLRGFAPIVTSGAVRNGSFDPAASAGNRRVLPEGLAKSQTAAYTEALRGVAQKLDQLPTMIADHSVDGATGSNSWVVAGSRTETGKPILANDPHLATSIPSTFVQIGLHCRTVGKACPFEVSGYSFAGMPGVVVGHNATMAWGLTTSYVDVQDLYLEQLRGDSVRVGDKYQPLEARTEEIRVAGESTPRTITVRSTKHGPLLSDSWGQLRQIGAAAAGEGKDAYAVSLAWTGLQPSRTMDALLRLNVASNFTQFRAAAKLLGAPSQNLVYADIHGNIGYQLPGAIPERGRGDGDTVAPGWDPAYDWKGLIPFGELPWAENPADGYIVTANNQIIGQEHYSRKLGSTYSYGWRSQTIVDALRTNPRISVAQNLELQNEDVVRFADVLVPRLLKLSVADSPTTPASWVAEGQQTLVGWDYSASTDSAAAAYFFVVVHNVLERTFRDQMPEELWPSGGDRWYAVLTKLLDDPDNAWWDDTRTPDVRERRDDVLRAAMTDARKELTSLMSRETSGWEWGKLHRVTLQHQTLGSSGIRPIEKLFNRGDWPVGGGPAVVNAMSFDDTQGYRVNAGPTMRMVVDLSELDKSRWINQSGNSGHAYNPNYDDQAPLWIKGETLPFVTDKATIESQAKHRLNLVPTG